MPPHAHVLGADQSPVSISAKCNMIRCLLTCLLTCTHHGHVPMKCTQRYMAAGVSWHCLTQLPQAVLLCHSQQTILPLRPHLHPSELPSKSPIWVSFQLAFHLATFEVKGIYNSLDDDASMHHSNNRGRILDMCIPRSLFIFAPKSAAWHDGSRRHYYWVEFDIHSPVGKHSGMESVWGRCDQLLLLLLLLLPLLLLLGGSWSNNRSLIPIIGGLVEAGRGLRGCEAPPATVMGRVLCLYYVHPDRRLSPRSRPASIRVRPVWKAYNRILWQIVRLPFNSPTVPI